MADNKDVTYRIEQVTGRLSTRIANLEVALAHEQAAKEAYMQRVEELERLQEDDEEEDAE